MAIALAENNEIVLRRFGRRIKPDAEPEIDRDSLLRRLFREHKSSSAMTRNDTRVNLEACRNLALARWSPCRCADAAA